MSPGSVCIESTAYFRQSRAWSFLSEDFSANPRAGRRPRSRLRRDRDFAMGKVSDARKEREVEIAKTRAKPVGPVVRKQRIVLGPPQASRHRDRGEERGLALHHADPGGMGGAIMAKAAGDIAGLQEIAGES